MDRVVPRYLYYRVSPFRSGISQEDKEMRVNGPKVSLKTKADHSYTVNHEF